MVALGCAFGPAMKPRGKHMAGDGPMLLKFTLALTLAFLSIVPTRCSGQVDRYYGRYDPDTPAPRCCIGTDCLAIDGGRYAFVTSVRTPDYLVGLRELHCSLQRSNPNVSLIVMGVDGDLAEQHIKDIQQIAEYRLVSDIKQENQRNARFGLNWVKLRVWEWTEFDAVIMLDADTVVLGDLTHLFSLPTDFAWAPYQGHSGWKFNRGGFVFLRPCQALFDSMHALIQSDSNLRFVKGHAEQSFLGWYFRYTAWELPMSYNLNFRFLVWGETPGGEAPRVMHFANKETKPFATRPGDAEWPYLCWQPQQQLNRTLPNSRYTATSER